MIKERHFSPKYDFKTGIIAKISFAISLFFILIIIIEIALNLTILLEPSIFFALTLLFLAVAGFSLFFYSQFAKLSRIVSEIEDEEENE
jgi:hypothetical protein